MCCKHLVDFAIANAYIISHTYLQKELLCLSSKLGQSYQQLKQLQVLLSFSVPQVHYQVMSHYQMKEHGVNITCLTIKEDSLHTPTGDVRNAKSIYTTLGS